uniref:DUF4297 domain-containing protein n=1 Tax=Rhizobium rhizogenes TaxID=359 RepID=A0A7S4ZRP4_RHIRH|nr:DUF4297 family anti-phage-associated protein [Rhizobium rhizogenes]QCL09648.1 hypothetical protein pC5.8a_156 [Rhizobium rhizogenes]
MTDRSAVATIAGYFYQFDQSILRLLELAQDSDTIDVECIEDIDVRTATEITAVQCKYYENSEYNHSIIKSAIMYMLVHFHANKSKGITPVKYLIFGHYASGQQKLTLPIDVDFLKKNFLTYTEKKIVKEKHLELGLSDLDLQDFLSLLTIEVNAPKFSEQFTSVIKKLASTFGCGDFAAEFFFYNNALRVIKDLTIQWEPSKRRLSKRTFLKEIDTSKILFNEWFVERKGKQAYLKALRAEFFTTVNVSPHERFFLIEVDDGDYTRSDLKELLFLIAKNYSKLSRREKTPFSPYVFISGIMPSELLALKNDLHREGFAFLDGFDFNGADFDSASVSRRATHDGPKIRIIDTWKDVEATIGAITKTRKVYQFYGKAPFARISDQSIAHVQIQVEHFNDIKKII